MIKLEDIQKGTYKIAPNQISVPSIDPTHRTRQIDLNQFNVQAYEDYIEPNVDLERIIYNEGLEESRAQSQSSGEKLVHGVTKGLGLAATTFASTFTALPYGIEQAVQHQEFNKVFDNEISRKFDEFNKSLEDSFPNYYTQEEQNAGAFSPDNWFTVNFLSDKLLKNAGFTVGAIAGGGVVSKAIGGLGKLAMGAKYTEELSKVRSLATQYVAQGMDEASAVTNAIDKVGKGIKLTNNLAQNGALLMSAGTEASIEALQTKQETFKALVDNYKKDNPYIEPSEEELEKFEDLASSAGNVTFGANIGLLYGSNKLQFGKMLKGFSDERRLIGNIAQEGKEFVSRETMSPLSYIKPFKGLVTESFEEGAQFTTQKATKDYYTRKYDADAEGKTISAIDSVVKGLSETFGTKEGLESMLLGALTGSLSSVVTGEARSSIREDKQRVENTEKAAQQLNKLFESDNFRNTVRAASLIEDMDKSMAIGDKNAYLNQKNDLLKSAVETAVNTGKFDVLTDRINDLKDLPQDEFNKYLGLDQSNTKSPVEYIAKLQQKVKALKEAKDATEERFAQFSPQVREHAYDIVTNLQDRTNRIKELEDRLVTSGVQEIFEPLMNIINAEDKKTFDKNIDLLANIVDKNKTKFVTANILNPSEIVEDLIKLRASQQFESKRYEALLDKDGPKLIQKKVDEFHENKEKQAAEDKLNKEATAQQEAKAARVRETQANASSIFDNETIDQLNKRKKTLEDQKNSKLLDDQGEYTLNEVDKAIKNKQRSKTQAPPVSQSLEDLAAEMEYQAESVQQKLPFIVNEQPIASEQAKEPIIGSEEQKIADIEKRRQEAHGEVESFGIKGSGHKTNKDAHIYIDKIYDQELANLPSESAIEDKSNAVENGKNNTKKILDSLKQKFSNKTPQGIIIRLLEKIIDFSNYSIVIDDEYFSKKRTAGAQATEYGMIVPSETFESMLNGDINGVHTFIHELIHGFTTSKISDYNIVTQNLIPGYKSALTEKEFEAIKQLERIYNKYKSEHSKDSDYGLKNLDEFIAEAFSNSSFQSALSEMPSEGKSSNLFSEFIESIRDVLYEAMSKWAKRFNKEVPSKDSMLGIVEDIIAWTEDLIPTISQLEELHTEETTGYEDVNEYDSNKNNLVDKSINTVTEELIQDSASKSVDENDNLQVEGFKIDNGHNAIAYLSMNYNFIDLGNGRVGYENIEDTLNENSDKQLLNADKFNVGEELELSVDESYNGLTYTGEILNLENQSESWQTMLNDLKVKYGENYKQSQEYIDNVPIRINSKNAQLKHTFLHNVTWINPNKVIGNIEQDKANLRAIRSHIIQLGSFTTQIISKTNGALVISKTYVPLSEINDKNIQIATVDTDGSLNLNRGVGYKFDQPLVNKSSFAAGTTVFITKVGENKWMAIPVKKQKISEAEDSAEIIQSITDKIQVFLSDKSMTIEELRDYVTMFVNDFNTNGQDLKKIQNSLRGIYDTTKVVFSFRGVSDNEGNTKNDNIAFLYKGDVYETSRNKPNKKFLDKLSNALSEAYLSTNISHWNNDSNITFSSGKQVTYQTFLKQTSTTNIKGFEVDKDANGEPIYSYTIQKVIRMNFKDILPKNIESTIEETSADYGKYLSEFKEVKHEDNLSDNALARIEFLENTKGQNTLILPKNFDQLPNELKHELVYHEYIHKKIIDKFGDKGLKNISDLKLLRIKAALSEYSKKPNIDVEISSGGKVVINDPILRVANSVKKDIDEILTYGLSNKRFSEWLNDNGFAGYIEEIYSKHIEQIKIEEDLPNLSINYNFDAEDLLPPSLDKEKESLMQQRASAIYIQDLGSSKQFALVGSITNDIISKVNKDGSVNTDKVFESWKSKMQKDLDELNSFIAKNPEHKNIDKYNKIAKSLNAALTNWDVIVKQTTQTYKNINDYIEPNDNNLDEQESVDQLRNDFDKSNLEKDPMQGLSSKVKIILAGIKDATNDGKTKTNWLGKDVTIDYRVVFNTFQQWTTDMLWPTFDDMLTRIKDRSDEFSWVNNAVTKLESISSSDRKAFVHAMINNYARPIKTLVDVNQNGGIKSSLLYPSKSSATETILDKWNSGLIKNSLVNTNTDKEYVFNEAKAKELYNQYQELSKQDNPDIEQLKAWSKEFGVELNDKTWNRIKTGNYRINGKKIALKELLNNSASPFNVLSKSIKFVNSETLISEFSPLNESAVRKLATFAGKLSDNIYSNRYRTAGKSIYPFNKNTYLSNTILELRQTEKYKELLKLSFSKHSLWLNSELETFRGNLNLSVADLEAIKKIGDKSSQDKGLNTLSEADYQIYTMSLLYAAQADETGKNKRIISLMYPTQSDKTTAMILSGIPAFNIEYNSDGTITRGTVERLYTQLALPEIERIIHFQKNIDAGKDMPISGLDKGWNKFYLLPSLNTIKGMFDKNGRLNTEVQNEFKDKILDEIQKVTNELVEEKISNWKEYGIIDSKESPKFIDTKAFKTIDKVKTNKSRAIATDMVLQYLVGNANAFMTMVYDPALAYKSKSTDLIQQIKDTSINIGKRLAADIAPGSETEGNNSDTYIQAFVNDRAIDSLNIGQYRFIIGKDAEQYTKDELLKEGTNAQEFVTVSEQFARLFHNGKIDEDFYTTIVQTIAGEISSGNHYYMDKVRESLSQINPKYATEFDEIVLQVEKPVYVGSAINDEWLANVRYYIKSSAYALTPDLTQGNDLDNIRIAMEKQQISRLAFSSGIKLGNFKNPVSLWDENNKIKSVEDINFQGSSVMLRRSGFRIQQEVPYDPSKKEIIDVSQARKNSFLNLSNVEGFEYNGKIYKGSELELEYMKNYKELYDLQKTDFANKIGYNLEKKTFDDFNKAVKVLKEILVEEAEDRGYPLTDIESLELDENLKFLSFSASAQRFEALMNSLVENRVLKLKFPGKSFVLSTEEGYQGKGGKGITYTDKYSGELKPQRIVKKSVYNSTGVEELVDEAYYNNNLADCLVLPAQILVPWKFRDNNGNILDIKKFVDKNGKIDNNKLPKELREIFGMRIPNQGLNSQSYIEIVGFLPHNAGDICVATRDYLAQMGSDFDVDKLYTYMFNTFYNEKTGKLYKFRPKEEGAIDGIIGKPKNKESVKRGLINNIIDIHMAIHKNPAREVQSQILEPLGTGEFEDIAKMIESAQKDKYSFVWISDQHQQDKRLNAASGKALVGIFSNLSMFNAVAQGLGLKFSPKDGFEVNFGSKTSHGEICPDKNISGKNFVSQVISWIQSCAVDNEKLQVCDKFNWSLITAKQVNLLAALGFDKEIALFTAQPVIKQLVKDIKSARGVTQQYEADILGKKLDAAIEYIKNDPNFSDDVYHNNYQFGVGLSISNMEAAIKDSNTEGYNYIQLAALEQYKYLDSFAGTLSAVMGSINTDSAGLQKNYFESLNKEVNVNKVKQSITFIDNVERLLENNINGYATDILRINNSIWDKVLPYNKKGLNSIMESIMSIMGKQDMSVAKKAVLQKEIYGEFKSYLYTMDGLGLTDQEILSERNRLFIGENSLANVISALQEQEHWKNHSFIGKLIPQIQKDGSPSKVTINAAQEDLVEQSTIIGAYDLLINDKAIEGTNYTTRTLMQDLILAAYLSGGIQQAEQYIKYIPPVYLHTIPFVDKLTNSIDKFNDSEFMQLSPKDAKSWDLPNFIVQYFQNNSNKIQKIKTDKQNALVGVNKIEVKDDILEKFSTDNTQNIPVFLASKSKKKGANNVYIHRGEFDANNKPIYTRIPTLGYTQFKEYNANLSKGEIAQSVIANNKANNVVKSKIDNKQAGVSRVYTNLNEDYNTVTKQLNVKSGGKEQVKTILDSMFVNKDIDPYYAYLANIFSENIDKLGDIKVDSTLKNGRAQYDNKTVRVNMNYRSNDKLNGFADSFIHELIHGFMNDHVDNIIAGKVKGYTTMQLNALNRLKNIHTEYLAKVTKETPNEYNAFVAKHKAWIADMTQKPTATQAEVDRFYGAYNFREFVTMSLTSNEFQKILNEIPAGKQTLLDKVIDNIKNALSKLLGIEVKSGSALDIALTDILTLVKSENVSSNKPENTSESSTSIYPQLGDKTATGNVVIKSVYQRTGVEYAKSIGGIFSLRLDYSNKHFGNPFSHDKALVKKDNLIQTSSTKEAVENYIDWIVTDKFKDIQPERRQFIIEQLKLGNLKNRPIVYYKELNEPSHATALDYLINKYEFNEVIDSLLPPTRLPKLEFLRQYEEINNDGTQKRTLADTKDTGVTRWKAMIARAKKINLDRFNTSYSAKAIEVVQGKKVYYTLALTPKEDVSLIDRMNSLTEDEVTNRIKYCNGK